MERDACAIKQLRKAALRDVENGVPADRAICAMAAGLLALAEERVEVEASKLPGFMGLHEVIGMPGEGFERKDEPTLPHLVLSGDEALHLNAIAMARLVRGSAHPDRPREFADRPDPECEICRALWSPGGKIDALTNAATERAALNPTEQREGT